MTVNKRIQNIDAIFHPESIAFIGATDTKGKWGNVVFENIVKGDWKGNLYPVNPVKDNIMGYKAYPSVKDIPGKVDLAVFTIPAKLVPDAIDECVEKGVRAGVIISAGFRETGAEGAALEKIVVEKAEKGNMVLAGPNGQGIMCTNSSLYSWLPGFYPRLGTVGIVSQSGNIMSLMTGGVVEAGAGVSKGVSSGNEADLKAVDYFEYYAQDNEIEVILSYMESMQNGRDFFMRVKEVTRKKPVILLKGGRSALGAKAASSHTGAMAVSDDLFSIACKQAGIIRTHTVRETGDIAASFVNRPLPKGNKVGILTGGGGLGVLATDAIADEGLEMARFSKDTLDKLAGYLPEWWVPGNPVDTVAGMNFSIFKPIIEILASCSEMDALMLILIGAPTTTKGVEIPEKAKTWDESGMIGLRMMVNLFKELAFEFGNMQKKYNMPIYPIIDFPEVEKEPFSIFQKDNRIAFYRDAESACKAIGAMWKYKQYLNNVL